MLLKSKDFYKDRKKSLQLQFKNGGPDPSVNTRLKDVIAKAKQNNVPNDNIDRMLKKLPAIQAEQITKKLFTRAMVRAALQLLLKRLQTTETELPEK